MKKYNYETQPEPPSNTGRTTIDSPSRRNQSVRASNGNLAIIRKKCVFCGHHKAIRNEAVNSPRYQVSKCSKCKRDN